jgi:hypothetical protein
MGHLHLGSLNVITSESGTIEQEMSLDAWGNRRDPGTWQNLTTAPINLITDRGFTGHEHLDGFKLSMVVVCHNILSKQLGEGFPSLNYFW